MGRQEEEGGGVEEWILAPGGFFVLLANENGRAAQRAAMDTFLITWNITGAGDRGN
jgi:hypothetical protein